MKKILAILGSPHKGDSFNAVKSFEEKLKRFGDFEFEYVLLKDANIKMCKGCFLCLSKGEEFCPSYRDDVNKIVEKMMAADGVIFATPVFSLQVTAYLKNLFDRLAYIFHRPCMHGKTSIAIVTQGVYGEDKIREYIDELAKFWGFNICEGVGISVSPDIKLPADVSKNEGKIAKAAERFNNAMNKCQSPIPSIKDLIMFRMIRSLKPYYSGMMPRDYDYFKEKGWMESDYFYDVKLGLIKRMIGKFMDKQGIKMGMKYVKDVEEYKTQMKNAVNVE